jgi:hypothetical protein
MTQFALNLDAARAQRAEARKESLRIQFGNELFDFPGVQDWPIELTSVLQSGDMVAALKLLLSEEDLARFLKHKPTLGDINELFEALGNASGVGGLGNSQGSRKS